MSMIQISKRQKGTSKLVDVLIRIGAIVLSLIFIGIVLAIMGYDPFKVFGKIIQTPFKRFKDVMNKNDNAYHSFARYSDSVQNEVLEYRR